MGVGEGDGAGVIPRLDGTETVPDSFGVIVTVGVGVGDGVGVEVETSIGVGIGVSVAVGVCPNATRAIKNAIRVIPPDRECFRIELEN